MRFASATRVLIADDQSTGRLPIHGGLWDPGFSGVAKIEGATAWGAWGECEFF